MINFEEASRKAKNFIAEIKGLDIDLSGRKLIDWLNFEPIKIEETNNYFTLKCTMQENLFRNNIISFKVLVNKETGVVDDFKRWDDQ